MRRTVYLSVIVFAALLAAGCGREPQPPSGTSVSEGGARRPFDPAGARFITVVKSVAFNWFKRMEAGVRQFAKDTGVTAAQQGPSKADSALQLQVIEDAIAQRPDALLVVPFQPEALEPALKKAMDEGIVVVSHEASNARNVVYDVEAFDNAAYGRHIMDELARRMNGEGNYVVFVGSLTSTTHNEWVDAASSWQKQKYPRMKWVGGKNETFDDTEKAYQTMKDLLKTYRDIKGVQGSAATDVVGAAQAIEEAGLQDRVAVVGTSTPSYAGHLLESGAIDLIVPWDPANAGYAMNKVALMVLRGETITDGMDLGIPGYEKIRLVGKVIYGSAWIDIDRNNMSQYPF